MPQAPTKVSPACGIFGSRVLLDTFCFFACLLVKFGGVDLFCLVGNNAVATTFDVVRMYAASREEVHHRVRVGVSVREYLFS